jgi:hypothetical protein
MTANPPEASADVARCDACGQPLGDAERFCSHCGAPLAGPSPDYRARVKAKKWRRRRRLAGVLAFVVVVAAIAFIVVSSVGGDDEPKQEVASDATRDTAPTTTTAPPPAGPYEVTDGLNIRSGPGAAFPSFGQIEVGNEVQVMCVTDGEVVPGPLGPTNKWLRIVFWGPPAYVTAGPDIASPTIIPPCAPA